MRPNRNPSKESLFIQPINKSNLGDQDPGHRGLRVLARMIARAYLEEVARNRLAEMGLKPKFFIETIKLTINCMDLNNAKERQKLHASIDEAIEAAQLKGWRENSTPFVFKKDGLSVMLKG